MPKKGKGCDFIATAGIRLARNMALAAAQARENADMSRLGNVPDFERRLLRSKEIRLTGDGFLKICELDFGLISPPGMTAHIKGVCADIDAELPFLTRSLKVVTGIERFAWEAVYDDPDLAHRARVAAAVFAAATGTMAHGHFFDLTSQWIAMSTQERLVHMEATLRPYG